MLIHKIRCGFTLIELSMVLVIIGLIVGGIVVGSAIIRAAELQSILTDIDHYNAAVYTFKSKYNALPGDMPNAEELWGSDDGCPTTPANDIPKAATCNANNDGILGDHDQAVESGLLTWWEPPRVWQQLSNAGLIQGAFTGAMSAEHGNVQRAGYTFPLMKAQGMGITLSFNARESLPNVLMYPGTYNHIFAVGSAGRPQYQTLPMLLPPALRTSEMLQIDRKVDDGKPAFGIVRSYTPNAMPCTTNINPNAAVYDTAQQDAACTIIYISGF